MLTHLHRYKEDIYSNTAMIRLVFCPRGNLTSTAGCGGGGGTPHRGVKQGARGGVGGGGATQPWVVRTLMSEEAKLEDLRQGAQSI